MQGAVPQSAGRGKRRPFHQQASHCWLKASTSACADPSFICSWIAAGFTTSDSISLEHFINPQLEKFIYSPHKIPFWSKMENFQMHKVRKPDKFTVLYNYKGWRWSIIKVTLTQENQIQLFMAAWAAQFQCFHLVCDTFIFEKYQICIRFRTKPSVCKKKKSMYFTKISRSSNAFVAVAYSRKRETRVQKKKNEGKLILRKKVRILRLKEFCEKSQNSDIKLFLSVPNPLQ